MKRMKEKPHFPSLSQISSVADIVKTICLCILALLPKKITYIFTVTEPHFQNTKHHYGARMACLPSKLFCTSSPTGGFPKESYSVGGYSIGGCSIEGLFHKRCHIEHCLGGLL